MFAKIIVERGKKMKILILIILSPLAIICGIISIVIIYAIIRAIINYILNKSNAINNKMKQRDEE